MPWTAESIAREHFGIEGRTSPLPGERTSNFLVVGATERYVLKLHPASERADVALETAALLHLAALPGIVVPRVVSTAAGAESVELEVDGVDRVARMLAWLPGATWESADPPTATALGELGRTVASVDAGLRTFTHPALQRTLRWNLADAHLQRDLLPHVADPTRRAVATATLDGFARSVRPVLEQLPHQAIHGDANDRNVLVGPGGGVAGLIDFGDLCLAPRVCGLAVACAYAMFGHADPVRAVLPLVAGYHAEAPLRPDELAVLLDLVRARLAVSVVMAGWQHRQDPANEYLLVSQDEVWALLRRLDEENDDLAHYRFRDACGYEPNPGARSVRSFLRTSAPAPVLGRPLAETHRLTLDWSVGTTDRPESADAVAAALSAAGAAVGIGRYCEDRAVYRSPAFAATSPQGSRRTVHLGVDLFVPAGHAVHAPLAGVVHAFADNAAPLDYGPVVLLEHRTDDGTPFWTLYGHLSRSSLQGLEVGQRVEAGEQVATVGAEDENGGWPPHVHLQLLTGLVGMGVDVHGVAARDELTVWESLSPDPGLLLGVPEGTRADLGLDNEEISRQRASSLSAALSVSYAQPLHIVRGEGAYLYDEAGQPWLDLVNNVAHVGHAHPRVVAAAARQQALLNTNTRYLGDAVVTYARRLTATLPDPLSVCFFVNSGSEANDLALRLAYAHTRSREVLVLDHAYHGHLLSTIDISPYKFAGPGGQGRPERTHVVPIPDPYRGVHRGAGPEVTAAYVRDLDAILDGLTLASRSPAAFVSEPIPGTAGQVVLADGFLAAAYERVRAAGGVCVADEVQVGFGRVGSHFWGFELHGVVPDIVTMGKPIGNGHPMAAVVTTPEIARSFRTGMEYFNTFGGNPVSARVGLAVLDVIDDERLQARAARLGGRLLSDLRALGERHPLVGDVRGAGLFLGVELVTDRGTRAPAGEAATRVVEAVKRRGILLSSDGPDHNVLKIKPPLVLSAADCDRFVGALDEALAEVAVDS